MPVPGLEEPLGAIESYQIQTACGNLKNGDFKKVGTEKDRLVLLRNRHNFLEKEEIRLVIWAAVMQNHLRRTRYLGIITYGGSLKEKDFQGTAALVGRLRT